MSFATDDARMRHAVEVHGLKWRACPVCPRGFPAATCRACGGAGISFTLDKPAPCGAAGCPMGNPQ